MDPYIFDIQHGSFVDGPGIRTVIFFKGCNLRCAWCHNPESQSDKPELMIYRDKCTHCGKCLENCPNHLESCDLCGQCEIYCPNGARRLCGKKYSIGQLREEIAGDRVFYDASGGGVTFSGGECMLYPEFLTELLHVCREDSIQTAVDTAGHISYSVFEQVLPYTDMFLYDVKIMDSEKHRKYIGTDNSLILANLARLLERKTRIRIRIPLIAGINDDDINIQKLLEFCSRHGKPETIELLPYHRLGDNKYKGLGREIPKFEPPPDGVIDKLKSRIAQYMAQGK